MPLTSDDLLARLDTLGIKYVNHSHPPLFTVEESKALRGELPGGHVKNLFLRDKAKRFWLLTTLEDTRLDLAPRPQIHGAASGGRALHLCE
jgi:Ala-tRNA(Pro) deacylase